MIATLLAAAPTPSPSPSDVSIDGTPLGSPGFLGFVFTFALAIAVVFLFLSLTKQLRVVDRRAQALGLDDEDPRPDVGLLDTGAAGPDLEVDADAGAGRPSLESPDQRPDDDRPGGTAR